MHSTDGGIEPPVATVRVAARTKMTRRGTERPEAVGTYELVMQNCKARGVDLREASLKKADVSYTDFYGALFGKSNLTDAEFTESTGFDIDVLNNIMTRSKFSRYEAVRLLSGLDIEVVD